MEPPHPADRSTAWTCALLFACGHGLLLVGALGLDALRRSGLAASLPLQVPVPVAIAGSALFALALLVLFLLRRDPPEEG